MYGYLWTLSCVSVLLPHSLDMHYPWTRGTQTRRLENWDQMHSNPELVRDGSRDVWQMGQAVAPSPSLNHPLADVLSADVRSEL
jgi:hypothetical protein